ncbi:hypothetical protein CVT24_000569 [Panaeolus cyanescens]|uniref:Uncharacterized protein n=1 Tax=Panaeolus cyanescens TaxID=181874 RepID=A0A409YDC8_9AGAR|nr:hypothetical protein CVT24_000569 [Panaeolus cyanescens]
MFSAPSRAAQYSGQWVLNAQGYPTVLPVSIPFCVSSLAEMATAYSGRKMPPMPYDEKRKRYKIKDLQSEGFLLVSAESVDRPIVDGDGRIIGVVRPPPSQEYRADVDEAKKLMAEVGGKLVVGDDDYSHPRGSGYISINTGISHGQGTQKPARSNHGANSAAVAQLLESKSMQHLARYQSDSLRLYYPKCYQLYKDALDILMAKHPELASRNFADSIFPKSAFNLGGNAWSHKHVDSKNFPFGWCCITSLGDFSHVTGGHLILWDLGLILELPAGYSASILSALIIHSNIPTSEEGDIRYSFVQYFPGEIMRYVDNGCLTDRGFRKKGKKLQERQVAARQRHRRGYDYLADADTLIIRKK